MDKSSSKYNLCADFGLTIFEKIRWYFYCLKNNKNAEIVEDNRLQIKKFKLTNLDSWEKIDLNASPARRLCDFFWNDLEWDMISGKLGDEVKVLEMGCGTGKYGVLLDKRLSDKLKLYRGIDISRNKEWDNYGRHPKFEFEIGDASRVSTNLSGINFIFTQSALEHFPEDLTFASQVAKYVNECCHPVFQIHLMPSDGCLNTYLWHGYRHYTPNSISKITRLFNNNSKFELYGLGGDNCNKLHLKYITLPNLLLKRDYRKINNKRYNDDLRKAIISDFNSSDNGKPSFYALIIKTNF